MKDESPVKRGRDWRAAGHALAALIRDPERTDAVFDLLEALDRDLDESSIREFAAHPEGKRLLAERPDLLAALANHAALAELPEGSLGGTYLAFVRANGITADGLVEADEGRAHRLPVASEPGAAYITKRGRDCHDLWHVLTGYGTDEAGEISVLAFTYGQYRSLGLLLIVLAGAILGPRTWGFQWERYLWRAYRRGRQADLDYAPYEQWLALPLDEARRRACVEPGEVAHPNGIIAANRGDDAEIAIAG
jgi:ubiquinone biosynthesis protein COQ4